MQLTAKVTSTFDSAKLNKQMQFAMAKTLSQLVVAAKDKVKSEMASKFDRPTAYTLNSLFVTPATKAKLVAQVGLKNRFNSKTVGPAAEVLGQQFVGGERKYKRSEGAFKRMGMLKGDDVIVPGAAAPLDQYGNIKRSFIIRLLSYFQAFGEQGYKANSTADKRAKLARQRANKAGYQTINGVVYFYSPGIGMYHGKKNHLAAGIWQKSGIHGSNVKPVLLFVRKPIYQKRVDIEGIAVEVYNTQVSSLFNKNLVDALATARP